MAHHQEARLCRMTPSAWRSGLSTPTYYVSQKKHKGFFRRIQEAVEEVPANSRIEVVNGGIFVEKIVINKPVELVVGKDTESPTLVFRSTVVTVQAEEVLIEGFTIRSDSTLPSVMITSGKPILRECTIRGLEVCGGAAPTVEECQLGDCKGHSVYLRQRAGGSYFRNVITGSGGYGVLVESIGDVNFSYNTIAGSHLGQVCVRSNEEGLVKPLFNLNRITDDLDAAQQHLQMAGPSGEGGNQAASRKGKNANPRPMNIFKLLEMPVKQAGMRVQLMPSNKSAVTFNLEEEDVANPALMEESSSAGVFMSGRKVQPHFARNTIAACKLHGLVVKNGCGGTYEANYFTGNKGWGIFVDDTDVSDIPYFTHNHISANGGGVKVLGCPATFETYNVIFGNKGPQFLVMRAHPQFVLNHNMFRNCSRSALWLIGEGQGEVTQNGFESCGIGIRLEDGANPNISVNNFDGCLVGVLASNGCKGTFSDCLFSDIERIGVVLQNSAHTTFARCNFYSCAIGLQITKMSGGKFDSCTVQDSAKVSVEVSDSAFPEFTHCIVRDGDGGAGVSFHRYGGGNFFRNQIFHHTGAAVAVSDGSDPIFDENLIGISNSDGVVVSRGGCGVFTNNIILECGASGVVITGPGSAPVFRQNYILSSGRQGLLMYDPKGFAVCEKNFFVGSRRCHVLMSLTEPQVAASLLTGRGHRNILNRLRGFPNDSFRSGTGTTFTSTYNGTFTGTGTYSGSLTTTGSPGTGTLTGTLDKGEPKRYLVVRGNVMWNSIWAGVIIDGNIHAFLQGNTISSCRHGVLVYGEGHVTMLQNGLYNLEGGVGLGQDCSADIVANIFQRISSGSAIAAMSIYRSTIAFNIITNCDIGIFLRSATGEVVVVSNVIRLAKKCALYQHPDAAKSSRVYSNVLSCNANDMYICREETTFV